MPRRDRLRRRDRRLQRRQGSRDRELQGAVRRGYAGARPVHRQRAARRIPVPRSGARGQQGRAEGLSRPRSRHVAPPARREPVRSRTRRYASSTAKAEYKALRRRVPRGLPDRQGRVPQPRPRLRRAVPGRPPGLQGSRCRRRLDAAVARARPRSRRPSPRATATTRVSIRRRPWRSSAATRRARTPSRASRRAARLQDLRPGLPAASAERAFVD